MCFHVTLQLRCNLVPLIIKCYHEEYKTLTFMIPLNSDNSNQLKTKHAITKNCHGHTSFLQNVLKSYLLNQ